jgi:hypothetical protein
MTSLSARRPASCAAVREERAAPVFEPYVPGCGARRIVCASDGTAWSVSERSGLVIPGARGPSCLVFDSPACVRRVWSFPADWRALSDEALLALSLGR